MLTIKSESEFTELQNKQNNILNEEVRIQIFKFAGYYSVSVWEPDH